MAACPKCKTPIPADIPLKGDVSYPCVKCGRVLANDELRGLAGLPVPEEAKTPKKGRKKAS